MQYSNFGLRYSRRRGLLRHPQGGVSIEQIAQSQKDIDAHGGLRSIAYLGACKRVKHPRGDGKLSAIGELDHKTIGSVVS
jgi:hypothetical protein